MPHFTNSSQQQHWTFTQEELQAKLKAKYDTFASFAGPLIESANLREYCLSAEEEEILVSQLSNNIIAAASSWSLSNRVVSTAISYFQRFFLKYTSAEYDPLVLMFTALYVACKTEEVIFITSVEHFCKPYSHVKPSDILRHEIVLITGINFQLYVFSPYKSLDFVLKELSSRENFVGMTDHAIQFVHTAIVSHILFKQTPSFIALAALYAACEAFPDIKPALVEVLESLGIRNENIIGRVEALASELKQVHAQMQVQKDLLQNILKKAVEFRRKLRKASQEAAAQAT